MAAKILNGLSIAGAEYSAAVALTDAATITVNASQGNYFRVTLGGSRTLAAPTNPQDGQMIIFEFIQDGTGGRTLVYTGGTGGYAFSASIPAPVLTGTPNKRDFIGFIYNSTANLWYCIALVQGY